MPRNEFPSVSQAKQRYEHGTHARYVLARCRCEACQAANRTYEKERTARQKKLYELGFSSRLGLWVVRHTENQRIAFRARTTAVAQRHADNLNARHTKSSELIPTANIVSHIRLLQAQGVGVKTIGTCCGVASSVLTRILDGDIVRTRRSTAAKILGVESDAVKDGARMRADDTFALIVRLVDAGYTRGWIAQQLGSATPALQVGRSGWISVGKARQIHELYRKIAARDPNVPKLKRTFKRGEMESSLLRFHGHDANASTTEQKLSKAPHGTAARARSGCRCNGCKRAGQLAEIAKTRFGQLRYITRATGGRWAVVDTASGTIALRTAEKAAAISIAKKLNLNDPRACLTMLVDATQVRKHLRALYAQGTTIAAIARASGISTAQVHFLMHGKSRRTSGKHVTTLLGLTASALPTEARIDARPTQLLMKRLEAAGFDSRWLALVLGLPQSTLHVRTKRVPLERARDIAALYYALRDRVSTLAELEQGTS